LSSLTYEYLPIWSVLNRGKPYEPFLYQVQHLHKPVEQGYSRIICRWGRRAGKSTSVIAEIAREGIRPSEVVKGVEHHPIIYVGGPNAESASRVWDPVWAAFVPPDDNSYSPPLAFLHESHDKQRGLITLKGGAKVYKKTGESPVSWQGERVTLIVMDEAHDMPEDVWENCMPALLDSGGRLIAIGVAKGKGRFRSYWHRGQGAAPNFYSSAVPTTDNPIIIDMARKAEKNVIDFLRDSAEGDLTDDEFARQYLAEEREEEGQVFRRFAELFTSDGRPGTRHIMGLDLGKLHDYTVAYVGDIYSGRFVEQMRVNKIDYIDQIPKIVEMYERNNCEYIHMDATGIGESIAELLRREGCIIIPFKFTNANKQSLVSTMVSEVEKGRVSFLKTDESLKKEMGLFEGSISPGGVIKYEAPKGYFDDCVIAAALLIQKMDKASQVQGSPTHNKYVNMPRRHTAKTRIEKIRQARQRQHEQRIKELLSA